ncbi:hypothetical protein [Streptomyces sp. NPDC003247]|uniref:hypothetical protein n=1 Tax=Streptomyces sp. NPDC003247 TaxID=3364677 RepID=UPI00369E847F
MRSWTRGVVTAGITAVSALGIFVSQATAVTPVGSWKGNTYSASDIAGSHAWGDSYVSGSRVYVTGQVRDTLSDGHGACLNIRAWYSDSVIPRDEFVADTDGNNSSYTPFTFTFDAGTVEYVDIQECLTESGDVWDEAPGWQAIVSP